MALLLRGEMYFLWQYRKEALQDLNKVADMSDVGKEVGVSMEFPCYYVAHSYG